LFPAVVGNVLLHLAPYWAALFSFYFVFTDVRDELDPDRVFANSMLDELFP